MKLAALYQELYAAAGRRAGWHPAYLPGGARLDVKRSAGVVSVCLSRRGKKLGDVELVAFQAHFQIPASAKRQPENPAEQGTRPGLCYYVIYSWKESANDQQQPAAGGQADRPVERFEQRSLFGDPDG